MGTPNDDNLNGERSRDARWPSRPALNLVVRALVLAVPVGASVAAGVAVSRLVTAPSGPIALIAWYALIIVSSLAVLVVADHFARRFLPLAVLLRLALVFPDQAPSRLSVALNAGNPRRLAGYLHEPDGGRRGTEAETILTLAAALNAHDRRTRGHSERVRAFTELVAVELALGERETEQLQWAAFLHDIGKLRVPPAVLNKRGQLDGRERSAVRRHPVHGEELVQPLAAWLGDWIHAIGDHHEKYDGTGYPTGRAGNEISLGGRIVSVTDSFETMTAVRSYNRPKRPREAREELTRCAGTHFDPSVVRAFLGISLGRLRWTAGLAAFLAQLPILGVTARASAQVVTTAAGVEASSGSIVGTAALAIAGVATPLTPAFLAAATWPGSTATAHAATSAPNPQGTSNVSTPGGPTTPVAATPSVGAGPAATGAALPAPGPPAPPQPASTPAPSGGSAPSTPLHPADPPPTGHDRDRAPLSEGVGHGGDSHHDGSSSSSDGHGGDGSSRDSGHRRD